MTNGVPNDTIEAQLLDGNEVALRGVPLMRRYRNDAVLTNEALGADGWFRTGDVGAWTDDGRLAIVIG